MTHSQKNHWIKRSSILALCVIVLVASVFTIHHFLHENDLEVIQKQAIMELEQHEGQYDTQSIVLQNTNPGTAKNLADKLGAKLRITANGSFATLTLPDGVSVADVYQNDENRELLEKFSLDLYASISDMEEGESEIHPAVAPKYSISDDLYSYQSYLNYLHMENIWEHYKGDDITVAVIDSGIDTDHPEFEGKISDYSYNATEDKIVKDYDNDWSLIEDVQGHGTSVAGVIAASMDGDGIVGIAPNVTLIVIKCECSPDGKFLRTSDLVFGLYYAIERDVDVVNMSFGTDSNVFADALRLAVDSDVICVAAAGNESTSALTYPAADPNCIGVGALANGSWELASYSNFGDNSDIVAPGTVYTTDIGGGYRTIDGTSFASPVTAAAVALLRQQNWNMEFEDVVELLYASSYDLGGLGEDFYYGFGALDMNALLLEERGKVTFDMLTDELEDLECVFIRNHTLQNLPEPERLYAVFDGWYYDIHVQDELNWYADKFTADLTLYANWGNEDDVIPYTYVILDDGTVEIRSYTGHRRYITIPEKIEGRVVSSIGDFAFMDQTRLRQINLPSGLVHIGLNAFANCSNLTQMAIPDGVKAIGAYTFENDARLYEVTFGASSQLTAIGDFAFKNCGLLSFELPQNVTNVNGSAFFGCMSLMNYSVRKGNTAFTADGGVLYNKTKSTLVAYPAGKTAATFTIPEGTTTVDACSFAYAKIKTIDLAKTEFIEESAFTGSALTKVDMPDTVVAVGKSAFSSCANLTEVNLSNNLTSIEAGTFKYCSALPSITIPKKVQTLHGGAFEACFSLQSVTFEEGAELILIDAQVFYMDDLRSIIIPAGVVSIGAKAFAENYDLASVTFAANSALRSIYGGNNSESSTTGAFYQCYALRSITLPENLTTIGEFAFEESGLTEVTIPANVSYLGVGAFASCHNLENIFVDDANINYMDIDGVVYTSNITEIFEYPAGRAVSSYTVNNTVTKIGDCAFYGSWNLTSVELPQGLETVGEYGFYDCESVYTYEFPASLVYIERYAFSYNTAMQYLDIPDNVIQISNYAFAYDYNCTSINLNDTSKLPRISFAAFAYTGINSFRVPANVSTMAQLAFEGCHNLYSVTFAPNSKLESISAFMFDGAENLQSITFENGSALKSIQAHGLEGMAHLMNVDFGDAKLENIDNYAFRYDESLQTLNIPDTVSNIGRYAFFGDKELTSLNIPASVNGIGRYAFHGAEKLNLYFLGDALPLHLQENWDSGIAGYYVDVAEVLTSGDWQYAKLKSGNIAIIAYTGSDTVIDLTALDLGGAITQIGGHAFDYTDVTSVKLSDTLELIQRYAFAHSKLTSVTIPANVAFIGQYAFLATPITFVTFEADSELYKIEQYAFAYTKQLKTASIPENVTVLESYAFYESGIENVTFAANCKIEKINPHTFASSALISVTIPDSVNYIDDNAFRDCLALQTVTLGAAENLQIHANAFYNTAISALTIPANVEYIGEYAFIGLENLSAYVVEEGNEWYKSVDDVLYSKDGRKLIAFPAGKTGSFQVPATVETIGFGAFENSKLSAVAFADGINLLTIGYRAFYNAKNLVEVSIPASVVSIDYYAFAMCGALETVNFAENNKLTGICEGAFYSDKSLKNITLPDSIIEISDYAFYGCTSLTRLPISEHSELKGIFDYAFAYSGISGDLVIPDTVIDLGERCFLGTKIIGFTIPRTSEKELLIEIGILKDCNNLERVTVPFIGESINPGYNSFFGYFFGATYASNYNDFVPESIKTVTLLEGCEFVGLYAFRDITKIEEVIIPKSVRYIYEGAFMGFTGRYSFKEEVFFKDIDIDPTNDFGTNIYGDLIIGGSFYNGSICDLEGICLWQDKLNSITINRLNGNLNLICPNLKSLTINESCTITNLSIGGGTYFENLVITNNIKSIDEYGIQARIKNLVIPMDNTESHIDSKAFYYSNIENIIDDNRFDFDFWDNGECVFSVIDDFLFMNDSLKLYLGDDSDKIKLPASLNGKPYDGSPDFCVKRIIIPQNIDITYLNLFNCADCSEIVYENGFINSATIFYPKNLKKICIPSTTESFDFDQLRDLKMQSIDIAIENERYHYDNGAIYDKSSNSLQYVIDLGQDVLKIIDGTETISRNAFNQITGIGKVVFPASITYIDNHAINFCEFDCEFEDNKNYFVENGIVYSTDYSQLFITKTIETFVTPEYLTEIKAFPKANIRNIVFSEKLEYIGDYAFENNSFENVSFLGENCVIGEMAFNGCSNLKTVILPSKIKAIPSNCFSGCWNLHNIEIPDTVEEIKDYAFSGTGISNITLPASLSDTNLQLICDDNLKVVINNSDLFIDFENVPEGVEKIISNTKVLTKKNREQLIQIDNYYFRLDNGTYYLVDFDSQDGVLYLPTYDFQYEIDLANNQEIKKVVFNNSFDHVSSDAFYNCLNLSEVVMSDSIRDVLDGAFSQCKSLEKILFSKNLLYLGFVAFSYCTNLSEVELPSLLEYIDPCCFSNCPKLSVINCGEQIKEIGVAAFENTAFIANTQNYQNGLLLLNGKYLISILENLSTVEFGKDILCVAGNACENKTSYTRTVIVHSNLQYLLNNFRTFETIIIDSDEPVEISNIIPFWFGIPDTLKQVVIFSRNTQTSNQMFSGVSGVDIFVDEKREDLMWDHDYPGWNNGNTVYYGGEWISCEWYDVDGNWIDTSYQSVNQIIRQPYVGDIVNGTKKLVFAGWDIDGDNIADCVPATSTKNIVAKAVMKEVDNICTVNFYDFGGNLISSTDYVYGDTIILPENPTKTGYTFGGWRSYTVGMTVIENMDFYGVWTHNGTGHEYVTTTIPAHCNEQGYDKHICSICGDEYHDNFTVAPGHFFGEWIADEAATCTETGSQHHLCTECSHREDEVIPAHGHDYHVINETVATCTTTGERVYECSYCYDTVRETIREGTHNYKRKVIGQGWFNPLKDKLKNIFYTYEGDKVVYYECRDCKHIMTYDESISLMSASAQETCDHVLGEWETVISPNYAEEGVEGRYCSLCHELIEARIVEMTFIEIDGATISGKVTSYNPNNAVTVELRQGDTVKYTTTIAATTGNGPVTQSFTITDVEAGTYDLVVTKAGHLDYTVTGVVVGETDIDLTTSEKAYANMTMIVGDIDGDGKVNSSDWSVLWSDANYLKSVEIATDKLADIDGDGKVNSSDWSVLWSDSNYLKGKNNSTFAY